MVIIGLTGGIASGKSTVSRMLANLGARIIDADVVAKDIVRRGSPAWEDIVAQFGNDILGPDGEIERKNLAGRVFGNPEALRVLNRLTHPRVLNCIEDTLRRLAVEDPEGVAVVDAPLLIESGLYRMTDEVWVVKVKEETQVTRAAERDGLSRDEVMRRLKSQMPLGEKLKLADRVIDNEDDEESTWRQVQAYWRELKKSCPAEEENPGESGRQ